jgi:hypothetical protein
MFEKKKSEPVRIRMLRDVGCGPQKEHPRMPTLETYPTGLVIELPREVADRWVKCGHCERTSLPVTDLMSDPPPLPRSHLDVRQEHYERQLARQEQTPR